jgi:heptosyltransferase-3
MQRGSKLNRVADFWLGVPVLNFFACLRRRSRWPDSEIKRVGVICSPALGDTLLFSAVVQDLRAYFDKKAAPVEIVHFCMKQNLAAAELIPGVDRRVLIHLTQPAETLRTMQAERLDVLLDFSSWQRLTAFYSMMSKARFTVGFRNRGQHRGRGYDLAIEHRNDRHEVDNFRAILHALNIASISEPTLIVPQLTGELIADATEIVVFHPWASGQNSWLREWPTERWVECAKRIQRADTVFVVTGSPADAERCKLFVGQLISSGLMARSFVSPDGFRSLAHLLLRSRVVVSVNTGVMHLAAVLGAPTVSLNGPTAPGRWGPRGKCVAGVEPADGSGGYLNLGFEFPRNPEDVMKKILVEDVVKAVERVVTNCTPRATKQDAFESGVLWKA